MKLFCTSILALALCARAEVTHRLGVTGGFPQMAAAAYQYIPWDYTTLEVFAGTFIINGTLGGRVIVSRTGDGFSPRAFVGACLVDMWWADKPEDPLGTSGYLWTGTGIGWNFPCGATLFADLGWTYNGNVDKGLGHDESMAISGGILFPI